MAAGTVTLRPRDVEVGPPFELRVDPRSEFSVRLEERPELKTSLLYLDGLLWYAFTNAPDETVREFGSDPEGDNGEFLGDVAIERVGRLRDSMPLLRQRWMSKSESVMAILGEVSYEVIESGGDASAILGVELPTVDSTGRPSTRSSERTVVRLWRDDVFLLIRELQHLLDEHMNGSADVQKS